MVHILGVCTGLCQSVDMGISKPLNMTFRNKWIEWMIDVGIASITTIPVSCVEVARCIMKLILKLLRSHDKGLGSLGLIHDLIDTI